MNILVPTRNGREDRPYTIVKTTSTSAMTSRRAQEGGHFSWRTRRSATPVRSPGRPEVLCGEGRQGQLGASAATARRPGAEPGTLGAGPCHGQPEKEVDVSEEHAEPAAQARRRVSEEALAKAESHRRRRGHANRLRGCWRFRHAAGGRHLGVPPVRGLRDRADADAAAAARGMILVLCFLAFPLAGATATAVMWWTGCAWRLSRRRYLIAGARLHRPHTCQHDRHRLRRPLILLVMERCGGPTAGDAIVTAASPLYGCRPYLAATVDAKGYESGR